MAIFACQYHRKLCLIFALALCACGAHAREKDVTNALQSVAGIYSSIAIHEFGHALAMTSLGASDIAIEVPRKGGFLNGVTTGHFPAPLAAGERRLLSVSGLFAASMAGEVVLQRRGLYGSPYAQAILGTSVVSNLRHVTTYYTRVRGKDGYPGNDIDDFELAGGNPHLLSAALVAYSVSALQRMRKKNIPFFYVGLRF